MPSFHPIEEGVSKQYLKLLLWWDEVVYTLLCRKRHFTIFPAWWRSMLRKYAVPAVPTPRQVWTQVVLRVIEKVFLWVALLIECIISTTWSVWKGSGISSSWSWNSEKLSTYSGWTKAKQTGLALVARPPLRRRLGHVTLLARSTNCRTISWCHQLQARHRWVGDFEQCKACSTLELVRRWFTLKKRTLEQPFSLLSWFRAVRLWVWFSHGCTFRDWHWVSIIKPVVEMHCAISTGNSEADLNTSCSM